MAKDDRDELYELRHDAAHVMATAVAELYPGTRLSIGPPIEDGFYYDFESPDGASPGEDDLPRIEERMRAHSEANEPFERRELPVAEAIEKFSDEGQPYKVELIEDLVRDEGVDTVSLYRNGPFEDLCRGPHGPSTGRIGAFKLNSLAGAYWRGDETRQMLTRIYGTAFFSQPDLEEHLRLLDEARARDHRRLGPELGLFLFREEAPGVPFWLPDGTRLLRGIEAEVRAQLDRRGWLEIQTPQVLDEQLWHRSGHYDNYRENMYFAAPLERERGDEHVFCPLDQVTAEVDAICEAIDELYARFGFDEVRVELSTRPERSIGTEQEWERAESSLREALERQGPAYEVSPGEGTFYGPKVDFHITDALGRAWQCGTCQLDFQMPERFGLTYTGADNAEHTPVMIHRALLGSMERFAGILIEHYAGRFPVWLAPVQAIVLPIADRHNEAADRIAERLRADGRRGSVHDR